MHGRITIEFEIWDCTDAAERRIKRLLGLKHSEVICETILVAYNDDDDPHAKLQAIPGDIIIKLPNGDWTKTHEETAFAMQFMAGQGVKKLIAKTG